MGRTPLINFLDIAADGLMLLDSAVETMPRVCCKLVEGLSLGYPMLKNVRTMTLGRAAVERPLGICSRRGFAAFARM
jgi:hypothetical protein